VKKVSKKNLERIVSRFGRHRILVYGDVMLDEYVWGSVNRISPEAPVPVVQVERQSSKLGGAANVALNLKMLGDQPILVGVTGNDSGSLRLKQLLNENQIESGGLLTDSTRPTTVKTRVIAHNQQVVRADWENAKEIEDKLAERVLDKIKKEVKTVSALIISDYGKGTITSLLLGELIELARKHRIFVAVDPKETHFMSYKKVSLITPNHHEAGFVSGRRITSEKVLEEVGRGLLDALQAESLLITRGDKGMSLFEQGKQVTHIPTVARRVYDVTGAGDTVISSFVSAVSAGADLKEAAWISNHAAGVVIQEIGTAQVSKKELLEEIKANCTF